MRQMCSLLRNAVGTDSFTLEIQVGTTQKRETDPFFSVDPTEARINLQDMFNPVVSQCLSAVLLATATRSSEAARVGLYHA